MSNFAPTCLLEDFLSCRFQSAPIFKDRSINKVLQTNFQYFELFCSTFVLVYLIFRSKNSFVFEDCKSNNNIDECKVSINSICFFETKKCGLVGILVYSHSFWRMKVCGLAFGKDFKWNLRGGEYMSQVLREEESGF